MDNLVEGDEVLVRATVTREGVRVGGRTLPASDLEVLTDFPKFTGFANPAVLLMVFGTEQDRLEFARSFSGLPDLHLRDL